MITWQVPTRYKQLPFRRLFMRVERPVSPDAEIVTAYTDGRVTFRRNVRVDGYHEAADLSGFQGVEVGDFVVHGLDILRGSVGVADSSGAISAVCTVSRPRPGAEPRYFAYAIRAQAATGFTRALARGIREGGADFRRWETLGDLPLPVPDEREQRAIANFLDRETARIDAVTVAKRQMIELLDERRRAAIMRALFSQPTAAWVRLSRFVDLLPGYAFPSERFNQADNGIRLLRGINVGPGFIRWDDVVHLETNGNEDFQEFALKPGDIVIGMDRPLIGGGMRVAEITAADTPALLVQRVARLRVRENMRRDYLRFALSCDAFAEYFSPIVTGVSVPHISPEQILSFRMPAPDLSAQAVVAQQAGEIEAIGNAVIHRLEEQIRLLAEHRQALITAAVTGAMEIPGVAA